MTTENDRLQNSPARTQCDTIITNAFIISMDDQRRMIRNGAIAITGSRIVYVGPTEEACRKYQGAVLDAKGGVVHPGLIDGHEHVCFHITRGWEPDWFSIHDTWTKFESKAFPAMTAEDQILSMKLAQVEMLKNGVTAFCDTGTAFFPDEVMQERNTVGIRGRMGGHIGDTFVPELAFLDKTTEQAVQRMERQLQRYSDGRVKACVGMSGMGNCSDSLVTQAKQLARQYGRVLHMHQCVYPDELQKYRANYGKTPIEHLHDLGVLDDQTALVHMIFVNDSDIALLRQTNTRVVHCPGASLKYSMGAMRMGCFPVMHKAGLRIALGTDASNWADGLDILMQVYLCATVHREMHPQGNPLNAEASLEMATLGGALVLGMADEVGAVKPGMRADLVIHRTDVPECLPAFDPLTNLVYAARSKSVDTVLVDGEIVLLHGKVTRLDEGALYEDAQRAAFALANRIGYQQQSHWPVISE